MNSPEKVLRGLGALHELGVQHRDLKVTCLSRSIIINLLNTITILFFLF